MTARNVPKELVELSEEVGEFIHLWGFKRIHGRLWTHLFLSEDPLDAGHLINVLGVSKALISLTLKELLRYGVIKIGPKSARGTQTYIANSDIMEVITNVLKHREHVLLERIDSSHKQLAQLKSDDLEGSKIAHNNVATLGELIKNARESLGGIISMDGLDLDSWSKLAAKNDSN